MLGPERRGESTGPGDRRRGTHTSKWRWSESVSVPSMSNRTPLSCPASASGGNKAPHGLSRQRQRGAADRITVGQSCKITRSAHAWLRDLWRDYHLRAGRSSSRNVYTPRALGRRYTDGRSADSCSPNCVHKRQEARGHWRGRTSLASLLLGCADPQSTRARQRGSLPLQRDDTVKHTSACAAKQLCSTEFRLHCSTFPVLWSILSASAGQTAFTSALRCDLALSNAPRVRGQSLFSNYAKGEAN